MKVGETLARSKNRLSRYGINYRHQLGDYYDLFLSEDEIKRLQINSLLVLTDNRPRSLIAIAYALRFAKALNVDLLGITRGIHQDLLKGETKDNDINLVLLKTLSKEPTIEYVLEVIQKHKVGLVIVHNLYALKDDLLDSSPIPVLVVKADQFFKTSFSREERGG
ncbi:MAG: hypothetical protein ACFE89_00850 [Candidatus Hodarchaeota archaeon]